MWNTIVSLMEYYSIKYGIPLHQNGILLHRNGIILHSLYNSIESMRWNSITYVCPQPGYFTWPTKFENMAVTWLQVWNSRQKTKHTQRCTWKMCTCLCCTCWDKAKPSNVMKEKKNIYCIYVQKQNKCCR